MNTSVLILGSKGMLGQELVKIFAADPAYTFTAWDREDIDVTNTEELRTKIHDLWPDLIFNAIAYNGVDACEPAFVETSTGKDENPEYAKAIALNVTYPGALATIAKTLGATIVHYSSDYVFDGERPQYTGGGRNPRCCGQKCSGCMYMGPEETLSYFAYHENDATNPLSRYGQTKRDGEEIVTQNAGSAYYVIRLSKLFGKPATSAAGKKAFFDIMLEKGRAAAESGEEVKAVDAETSKFTYAPDLARESKALVEEHCESGIYHIANDGAATWYDGVKTLYDIAGISAKVTPVPPETFPRPAVRPASSVLKMTKRAPLRHYKDALTEYVENLQ